MKRTHIIAFAVAIVIGIAIGSLVPVPADAAGVDFSWLNSLSAR